MINKIDQVYDCCLVNLQWQISHACIHIVELDNMTPKKFSISNQMGYN